VGFNPVIYSVATNGSVVYVGGAYLTIGGQSRIGLAAIDPATGAATDWDFSTNGAVYALTRGTGTLYAGGSYQYIQALPHSRLAGILEATVAVPPPAVGAGASLAAWPNPFRAGVTLRFALPRAGAGAVAVYDVAGRCVRHLRRGALAAGAQALTWNGRDDAGATLGPGLYFARVECGTVRMAMKVLRLR